MLSSINIEEIYRNNAVRCLTDEKFLTILLRSKKFYCFLTGTKPTLKLLKKVEINDNAKRCLPTTK